MGWMAVFFVSAFFFMIMLQGSTLDMPLATENTLFGILTVLAVIVVIASLLLRLRAADTEITRQQLKWILIGTGIAGFWIGLQHILYFITPVGMRGYWLDYISIFDLIVMMVFTGCITVAILQFQLFDIDIVINRSLVYGALTLFIVVAYAVIVGGLSVAFAQLSFAEDAVVKFITPLIATSLIVLAFQPLRDRLQRLVNRLMYGDRDEPYQVLTRLAQQLETALEPLDALPLTVETIAQALKLPYVAIALIRDGRLHTVAANGMMVDKVALFPLTYVGETIGELVAAGRTGEETFTEADRRLLSDLARQIAPVAHAALVSADLERARLRIVEAREEAGRRLGSDLHDGIGHQLAGLARQSEHAIDLLGQDPEATRAQLYEIKSRIDQTIVQVRRLAHQLYPPELELLGLAGALRERVQSFPISGLMIQSEIPESLPPLPTAIENAAYYIALEALTNVSKHAGARSCKVCLAWVEADEPYQSPSLKLEVRDDGRGLSPSGTLGLGMLSMQARAAEVGGLCTIEAQPGGGTCVSVRLPCPLREE
jgi:signal transduction histidine kinase